MRTLLLQIHLYAGLLCSSYFVIFGVSSLNYNHHFGEPDTAKAEWERGISLPQLDDEQVLAEAVRDSLGLFGWPHTWTVDRDEAGVLHFHMSRPGKEYDLQVERIGQGPKALVSGVETRTGPWAVVNQLHALTMLPNSPFMSWWGVYTEVCFWVVIGSAASGVYLWTRRRKERLVGGCLLAVFAGGSVLFMLYIHWIG